jgi:hypothetical protein
MINRLRRSTRLPFGGGGTTGFVALEPALGEAPRLAYNIDEADGTRYVDGAQWADKTANFTITNSDGGKLFAINATASVVATLPKAAAANKGMKVAITLVALPTSGAGASFSPQAADKIVGNGFTAAVDKDAIISAASDRIGDYLEVTSNGVDAWYITGVIGTVAREA